MSRQRHRLFTQVLVVTTFLFVTAIPGAVSLDDQPLPSKVGTAGDPDRIIFDGVQTYSSEQIRHALAAKPSYLLAAHPQAEMRPFLKALQSMVQNGYQAAGFPDAQVEVDYDAAASQVRVKVTEGRRFTAGNIRLLGVKTIPVAEFVRWFTTSPKSETPGEPREPSAAQNKGGSSELDTPGKAGRPQDPIWVTGDPVDFTASWATQALAQVEACIAEQGFFFPRVKVELRRAQGAGTADMLITISSLGPPGVINQMKVTGGQLNSASDIIKFLGLRQGMKLTARRLVEARRKLENCGRFWDFDITPEYVGSGEKVSSRYVDLQINVKELESVAPLSKALTPAQQALVRVCDWLEQFPVRQEVMQVSISNHTGTPFAIDLVVSPERGLLVNSADLGGASPVSAGLRLGEETIQFCAWASGSKLDARRVEGGNYYFFVRVGPNRGEGTNRFDLSLGGGYSSKAKANNAGVKPVFVFDIQLTPAAFLELAAREGATSSLDNGQLTLSNSVFTLRAEAETGRLIEVVSITNQPAFSIRFDADAWRHASEDFARRAASLTNVYVTGQGLTSFLALAAVEVLRWNLTTSMDAGISPDQRRLASAALRSLLSPATLAPLDRIFADSESNSFPLPNDAVDEAIEQNIVARYFAFFAFAQGETLFPKQSWPWTLAREGAFVMIGEGRFTEAELERLSNSEEIGPIGCLTIAQVLALAGSSAAKEFAIQGLVRLSERDFLRDCGLVVNGESGLARSFANLAGTLRTLPEAEVAALAATLPEAEATLIRESAKALRTQPEASLDSALSPALAKYWSQSLRAKVRSALQDLAKAKPADEGN